MPVSWSAEGFVRALERKVTAVDAAVARVAALSAHDLEARVKGSFTAAHPKGTPTTSQPGSAPAVVSGTLRRSIKVDGPIRVGFGSYRALVGPTVVYARVQELGGGPSKLPARPYFTPEYERFVKEDVMNRRLSVEMTRALHV